MCFCVVEGFAVDAGSTVLSGVSLGVAAHFAAHKEGDLLQFGFAIGGPLQAGCFAITALSDVGIEYAGKGMFRYCTNIKF